MPDKCYVGISARFWFKKRKKKTIIANNLLKLIANSLGALEKHEYGEDIWMMGIFVESSSSVIVLWLCRTMSFFQKMHTTVFRSEECLMPATTSRWFLRDR